MSEITNNPNKQALNGLDKKVLFLDKAKAMMDEDLGVDVGLEPVEWLLKDWFIKGAIQLFSGQTGIGKSRWLINMACRLLRANKDLIVVYQSIENDPNKFIGKCLFTSNAMQYVKEDRWITVDKNAEILKEIVRIREHLPKGHILLILDPPNAIIENPNNTTEVKDFMCVMDQLSKDYNLTTFMTCEMRKAPAKIKEGLVANIDNVTGSKSMTYHARGVFFLMKIDPTSELADKIIDENPNIKDPKSKNRLAGVCVGKGSYIDDKDKIEAFILDNQTIEYKDRLGKDIAEPWGVVKVLGGEGLNRRQLIASSERDQTTEDQPVEAGPKVNQMQDNIKAFLIERDEFLSFPFIVEALEIPDSKEQMARRALRKLTQAKEIIRQQHRSKTNNVPYFKYGPNKPEATYHPDTF